MRRILVYALIALLSLFGLGMILSFTAGGVTFGFGYLGAALVLWLLYRCLLALELSADLIAQGLFQRGRVKEAVDLSPTSQEPGREASRPPQPAASD